jgi:hypothetical protein
MKLTDLNDKRWPLLLFMLPADVARFSHQFEMTGAYGHVHSAALASAGSTSAAAAAGVPAAAAGGSSSGGRSRLGPGSLKSSSVHILSSVYRQQQHMAHQVGWM